MSNKKVTKRALLTSILAICLCLVMLIGSTFAWFTDTASTSVNQIQSGTLKVALEMEVGKNDDGTIKWDNAEGKTLQFKVEGKIPAEGTKILWEPNCTYELPALRVVNKGNLALKYKIQITGIKGDAMLNNVIDWTINDTDLAGDHELAAGAASEALTIKGHMQETAGNDYQNRSIDGIAITVLATQLASEFDSNDNTYDELAEYPVAASGTVTVDNDGKVTAPVTIVSAEKVEGGTAPVAQATIPENAQAETSDITQMTLSVTNAEKPANFHTLDADQTSNTLEVKMIGLSEENETPIKIALFVGAKLNGFKLYHHEIEMTAKDSVDSVINDQDYYYDSETGIVTFLTAKFSPFTLVYDKGNWSDNTEGEYETPVDETSKTVTIASAEELALFAKEVNGGKNYKGYTVKLTDDIDLGANKWTPIGKSGSTFQGIFDGQGHTISNLVCGNSWQSDVGLFGFTTNGEIKNFTLNNAKVEGYLDVGAVAGTPYTSKYTNIKLTGNVQVDGYAYVGGMFGKNAYANLTDLTIAVDAGSYVNADSENYRTYVGGLVGFMGEGNQVVKNVTSNINVIGSTCDVGGITGIAHYGNTFINCTSSGNVTLTNAQDEGDHLEIGGIAGVWLNKAGQKVTLTNCSFTGKLSTALNGVDRTSELDVTAIAGAKYYRDSDAGTLIIN